MKFAKKYLIPPVTLLLLIIAALFWIEADNEIRVLCQVSESFETTDQLDRLISTAENSRLFYEGEGTYSLKSHQNLRTSQCLYETDESDLLSVSYYQYFDLPMSAAKALFFLFFGMALFQAALAAGLPLGHLAWGGEQRILSRNLRIASAASDLFFMAGMFLVSEYLGWTEVIKAPGLIKDMHWGLFLLFFISTLANTIKGSKSERKFMLPVAMILCAGCFIIAIS